MKAVDTAISLHASTFGTLDRLAGNWLLPLLARLVFLAVLFGYYLNSFRTKVEEGLAGFFQVKDGAYFQILGESGMLAYEFDTANVPFHLDAVVYSGTYFELLLPILIVLGLFTRLAAAGMIVFVLVQSYVDIHVHGAGAGLIGQLFDNDPGSQIWDQRTLWVFLFAVLVIRGGGSLSLDTLLSGWWKRRSDAR